MQTRNRIVSVVVAGIAALAMQSSTASAQSAVEVTNEATGGAHCPALASGGCSAHVVSNTPAVLTAHVFGVESTVTTCNMEFSLVTNEDGNGEFRNQSLTGASCTRQACQVSGATGPWVFFIIRVVVGYLLIATICAEPLGGGTDTTCEVEIPVSETGDHDYVFNASGAEIPCHGASGFRGEWTGRWVTEASSTLEISDAF